MKLNRIQKKVLLIGFGLLFVVTIFVTPWGSIGEEVWVHKEHAPIFAKPDRSHSINYPRLGMYWILISIGTGVFIIYFKDDDK